MKKLSMKQISLIVTVTAFTILTAVVTIILNITKDEIHEDPLETQTNVGLVLNGAADDMSWEQSHCEALARIAPELNLNIIIRENVPEDARCLDTIDELVTVQDCLVVICNSFGFGDHVMTAAEKYPDRYFLHCSGTRFAPNLGSFFGRMYQLRYLSGIAAGMSTKTGHIGFVASFPISEVNRAISAFALGVRSVRPDAVVHVSFCGSWTDDSAAGKSADFLADNFDIDVLTMHTNSIEPLRVADNRGISSIGYNYDNSAAFPDTFLTGCVWKWDSYYKEQILSCLQGKFKGKHVWLGIESGVMELANTGDVKITDAVSKARARFEEHTFDVFYGPIKDSTGEIRIPADESMSDESMLDDFYWYAEGVSIENSTE